MAYGEGTRYEWVGGKPEGLKHQLTSTWMYPVLFKLPQSHSTNIIQRSTQREDATPEATEREARREAKGENQPMP